MVGDRLLMVALITLVYDRTGSAGVVGMLMVFKAIPALLLGSLAGVFVDRWNRKWIMVIANLLQGLLVFLAAPRARYCDSFLPFIWPCRPLTSSLSRRGRPPSQTWCRPKH